MSQAQAEDRLSDELLAGKFQAGDIVEVAATDDGEDLKIVIPEREDSRNPEAATAG